MKMSELAVQYRESAAVIRDRVNLLRKLMHCDNLSEMEKYRLRVRIDTLNTIMRETNEAAAYMEHYYDRGRRKNGRFSI